MAISEASSSGVSAPSLKVERDVYSYRSYIGSGKPVVVLDEIAESPSEPELALVRLHAELASGADVAGVRERLAAKVPACLSASGPSGPLIRSLAASLSLAVGEPAQALSLVRTGETMEQMSVEVAALLSIDRADLAAAAVNKMRAADDEAPLAVLAGAWLNQSSGPGKANEAALAYAELTDKYGETQQLLTGLGAACMAAGRFEDAEGHLIKAASSGPASDAVLANLIACSRHTGKAAASVKRLADELERDHARSPLAAASSTARAAVARVTGSA